MPIGACRTQLNAKNVNCCLRAAEEVGSGGSVEWTFIDSDVHDNHGHDCIAPETPRSSCTRVGWMWTQSLNDTRRYRELKAKIERDGCFAIFVFCILIQGFLTLIGLDLDQGCQLLRPGSPLQERLFSTIY